jgi:tRNA(Phe) wybutosine-synthesizing methylase Tyw3
LRKNCIAFFADLYPDGVFKNLYDVELYLDGLFSVERNKVGAVIEDAQTNLNDLKDKFASLQESLLQLMKEMEKMTENGTVN